MGQFVMVFIDDILIILFLKRYIPNVYVLILSKHMLYANFQKVNTCLPKVRLIRHEISTGIISVNSSKDETMRILSIPMGMP